MAKWLKTALFGRQLSHGSDKESPETFSEALQQQSAFNFEDPYLQNVSPELQQEQQMPTLTPFSPQQQQMPTTASYGASQAVGPSPGASEMKAAYTVS
jgi:hypothetical protein